MSFLVEWDKLDNLWISLLTLFAVIHSSGKSQIAVSLRMTAINLKSKGQLRTKHGSVSFEKASQMGHFLKIHKEYTLLGEQGLHF